LIDRKSDSSSHSAIPITAANTTPATTAANKQVSYPPIALNLTGSVTSPRSQMNATTTTSPTAIGTNSSSSSSSHNISSASRSPTMPIQIGRTTGGINVISSTVAGAAATNSSGLKIGNRSTIAQSAPGPRAPVIGSLPTPRGFTDDMAQLTLPPASPAASPPKGSLQVSVCFVNFIFSFKFKVFKRRLESDCFFSCCEITSGK
jgi:hypothetical protein